MKRLFSLISFICLFQGVIWGVSDSVMYTKDLKLNDGLYVSFNDLRSNNPILKSNIITNYNKSALDFFKQELSKTEIHYMDSTKTERTLKTSKFWGYCSNNNIYINYGREFSKIMVVGSICHFTASMEVQLGGSGYYQNAPVTMNSSYEYEQFVFSIYSGKILAFTVPNMQVLFKSDDQLFLEYMALKKKKKRELMFFYLRKFNEKHPAYFPV